MRLPEKFWDKVIPEPNSGCWLWTGSLNTSGYGNYNHNNRTTQAHRLSLASFLGRPLVGFALHSCDTRSCVNPRHLREGSNQDNAADRVARGRSHRPSLVDRVCKEGHPIAPPNVYVVGRGKNRVRRCRTCWLAYINSRYRNEREENSSS